MPSPLSRYEETLARLDEAFPGRSVLSKAEFAQFLGVSTKTVKRKYDLPPGHNSKAQIAKALCRD